MTEKKVKTSKEIQIEAAKEERDRRKKAKKKEGIQFPSQKKVVEDVAKK